MKFLLTLMSFFTVSCADNICKGLYISDKYYNVEILKEGISNIRSMAYDQNENTVYFIFNLLKGNPATVGYLNVYTKEAGVVDGVRDPNAVAVDTINNIVFIGGADGIYRLNYNKVPIKLPIDKNNIISLFSKDALYFTNTKREAYRYENGHADLIPELQNNNVDMLAIDNEGNIFFLEDNLLLRVKAGTRAVNTHEKYTVNFVTTNALYDVFIGATDGVYTYNKFKFDLRKQANMRDLRALTFNKFNEPIYAVADKILKLSPSEIGCFNN